MKNYMINYTDHSKETTTTIDTITAPEGYTAEQYIKDCLENADDTWNQMLAEGTVTIEEY